MPQKSRVSTARAISLFALFFTLIALSGAFAQEADDDFKKGDRENPIEREQWFLHGRTYRGRVSPELLKRAQQQRDLLRRESLLRRQLQSAAIAAAPPITPMWIPLGPSPLKSVTTAGDDQDYGPVTGRATAVAVDQNDPSGNTVYIGGAYGGVWKSTSAANPDVTKVFWTPMLDDQQTIAVGAIAIQPDNSNVILVGTGEANSSADSYYGLGILRSEDAGTTWSLITSANNGLRPFAGLAFSKIAFSIDNPNIVVAAVAAANIGITTGSDSAPTAAECADFTQTKTCRGIYYSYDSGRTWTKATIVDPGNATPDAGSVSSVHYNPQQHKFYAAYRAHGFYVSGDGITWTRMGADSFGFTQPSAAINVGQCPTTPANVSGCPIYRGEIAQVPGRDEMYVWFVDSGPPPATQPANGGIYQTKDGGKTWTSLDVSGITNCGDSSGCGTTQGDYNLALLAVPNGATATDVYAGAVNIFRCQINGSTSNCNNITHVYGCTPAGSFSKVHPDQHAFDFLHSNPNIVYFGNDGGIYRTISSLNATGVPSSCPGSAPAQPFYPFDNLNATMGSMTQFVWFAQHPTNQFTFIGGTQDNGSPAIDSNNSGANGLTWRSVLGGDGGYTEINPNNGNEWFSENTRVTLQRCTNGPNCTDSQFTTVVNSTKIGGDGAAFYMPYMLDPQDSTKLIIGTCRVWRTTTIGTSAVALSQKMDGSGGSTACSQSASSLVSALAAGGPVGANGSQVIYAGTDDGKVFFTNQATNSTVTWTQISSQGGFSNSSGYPISSITVDPNVTTGNTAYVTIMGFHTPHVWQTTNGGTTWIDITGNLPDSPADGVVVDKGSGTIYVATDVGVFSTAAAAGANTVWTEVGPATGVGALPNVAVTHIAIFSPPGQPPRMRVSTYGRGVWEMALPGSTAPDYSLAIRAPDLLTYPGQAITFDGTLNAFNGYNSTIALNCDASTGGVQGPLPQTCVSAPVLATPPATTTFSVTTSNNAVQDFSFRITGVGADSNTLKRQVPISLRVIDFALGTPSPSNVTDLPRGNSTTAQLTVTSLGSFDQPVTFSCSGLPANWSCAAVPVQPTAGGSAQSTLTINTDAATTPGVYTFSLLAQWNPSGLPSRTRTQNISVQVIQQPDFTLGVPLFTSPTRKVTQPLVSNFTISQIDGYTGTVNLSCTGTSAGIAPAACSFNSSSLTLGTTAVPVTLTVNSSGGNAGLGQITIQATDGTKTKTSALPFTLVDYALSNVTQPNNVASGGTVHFSFQLVPSAGFTGSVNLSCDNSALNTTNLCTFSPASPVSLVAGSTAVVNASLVVPLTASAGSYSVTVKSSDAAVASLQHNQSTGTFQVTASPDFTLDFGTKNSETINAGATSTGTLSVASLGGFASPVALAVSGCPSNTTCNITSPVTPSASTPVSATLTITTKAGGLAMSAPSSVTAYLAIWVMASFGCVGIIMLRRPRVSSALLMIACCLLMGLAACGGGGSGTTPAPQTPVPGTPSGTYAIVVTGTSGTTVHSINYTLTVR